MSDPTEVRYPDGKGGWTTVKGESMGGKPENLKKMAEVLSDSYFEDSLNLAERVLKFEQACCKEMNISAAQRAVSIAFMATMLRETYPDQHGGPAAFDALATATGEYFDRVVKPELTRRKRLEQHNAKQG